MRIVRWIWIGFVTWCTWCTLCPCKARAQAVADLPRNGSGPTLCDPGIDNKSRGRGFEVSYNYFAGGPINGSSELGGVLPQELDYFQRLNVKLKIPLLNKPGFKLLLGYDYQPEIYAFGNSQLLSKESSYFSTIDTRKLNSNGFGVYFLKPIDDRTYVGGRLKMRLNGDYTNWVDFDQRYAAYNATFLYGVKKSDDFEWGVGAAFSHNFRRTLALPFIMYNRNFSDKWGIEAVFPAQIKGRYNVDKSTILLFGYEFNSNSYSVDMPGRTLEEGTSIYHFNHSEIQTGISLERRVVPWVWLNAKVGYQWNFNTRLEATQSGQTSYELRPGNAPYLKLGFFLSPPAQLK